MTSTSLQNRVDPWGNLCAVPARGALMGNRGILHNDANRIVRPWAHKAWVACLIEFKDYKRAKPFSPGNYSELFFLDEATAFAAGHRPCAHCQRARHSSFKDAWVRANRAAQASGFVSMPDVDKVIHAERTAPGGRKGSFDESVAKLPIGAMFEYKEAAYVVSPRGYLQWSFGGYGDVTDIEENAVVKVLTPRSIVHAFAAGFTPRLHASGN